MRTKNEWISLAALVWVMSSCTLVTNKELDGKPAPPDAGDEFCRGLDDGTDCSSASMLDHICVGFVCVPRGCGDGYLEAPEVCDPPDGLGCCDGCQLCCVTDEECDDGDPCNGQDRCTDENQCVPVEGLLPAEGAACEMVEGEDVIEGFCCDAECKPEGC
jgi:hypothetical protein